MRSSHHWDQPPRARVDNAGTADPEERSPRVILSISTRKCTGSCSLRSEALASQSRECYCQTCNQGGSHVAEGSRTADLRENTTWDSGQCRFDKRQCAEYHRRAEICTQSRTLRSSGRSWISRNGSSLAVAGQSRLSRSWSPHHRSQHRGSTLSLAYSQTHPDRCKALILRGIFLLRDSELQFFYQHGTSGESSYIHLWRSTDSC